MSYQQLLFDVKDGVALITLNRPEAMNTWTAIMSDELTDAMHRCNDDNAPKWSLTPSDVPKNLID